MSTLSPLNKDGYPINPKSIYIAIQRKFFPHLDSFRSRVGDPKARIGITFRQNGQYETLHGRVTKITEFADGVVIHYPQIMGDSLLSWPDAILWAPNVGTIGILNPQCASDEEIQAGLDEMSQKHMEDSTTLFYIIEDLFRGRDKLPYGIKEEQVRAMTQFKQIEFLEGLTRWNSFARSLLGDLSCVMHFISTVNKNSFRTADDYKSEQPTDH